MPYAIRSLDAISQSVRGAFRQYMPGTDATLKQSVTYVIGKVQTLLAREYELRLAWIFRQLFLTTATSEPIVRMHCADVDIFQKPAAPAAGAIEGTGAPHETYPAGVRFLSGDMTYVTAAAFTADALGAYAANVQAERAGAAGDRDPGAALLLADPSLYPTLSSDATVAEGGLGGGADVEDIEALRRRGLKRKASGQQGGRLADYETWAEDVPGVAIAWAANFSGGFGAVGIWPLFASRINGIPTQADLDAVEAAIFARRLVRGVVSAVAAMPAPVDLTVRLSPDSVAQRAAVTAALQAFFDARLTGSRVRPSLPGAPFKLPVAWISEVISTTPGEADHTLEAPRDDMMFLPGELPVLGAITWAS